MSGDKFIKTAYWIDNWFNKNKDVDYGFNYDEEKIFNEIAGRWEKEDKLAIFNSIKEKYSEKLFDLIEKVLKWNYKKEWSEAAEKRGSNNINDIIEIIWKPLKEQGGMYSYEKKSNGTQFYCTKRPIHDVAKELNCTELLYHLVCKGDPYIVEAFNPGIGFKRTKTLMQGDNVCDHFYYMK